MDNLSVGKINFTRRGKSFVEARLVPRHSTGISAQASPSVFPANGPDATLQSTPVSQASPIGSVRFDFSGKRGANDRAPQILGLKMGSMRVGVGFTKCLGFARVKAVRKSGSWAAALHNQTAASARAKKRSMRRKPSSMRSMDVA